jgi:hypothetical protein
MPEKNFNIIIRNDVPSLSTIEKEQWIALFCDCFKCNRQVAFSAFGKYELNSENSVFCLGLLDDVIVACYSGIILSVGARRIFLSTDTMSNGFLNNATVKLGRYLYEHLKGVGVSLVCGFPNENVRKIREKKLGWKIIGKVDHYIGIPFFWRFFRRVNDYPIWMLERPSSGYFTKVRPLISLLGRTGLYGQNSISLIFTLSAVSPGFFFVKVPNFLISPKLFGYVLLMDSDFEALSWILESAVYLDLNCIDVP